MTDDPTANPVAVAAFRLHLAAGTYPVDHPRAKALRDLADAIEADWASQDPLSRDEGRRTALALCGTYVPPPLDPLPEPGTTVLGDVAVRLPIGSAVDRADVPFGGRRVRDPDGRWRPDHLVADIPYTVLAVPAQRVNS